MTGENDLLGGLQLIAGIFLTQILSGVSLINPALLSLSLRSEIPIVGVDWLVVRLGKDQLIAHHPAVGHVSSFRVGLFLNGLSRDHFVVFGCGLSLVFGIFHMGRGHLTILDNSEQLFLGNKFDILAYLVNNHVALGVYMLVGKVIIRDYYFEIILVLLSFGLLLFKSVGFGRQMAERFLQQSGAGLLIGWILLVLFCLKQTVLVWVGCGNSFGSTALGVCVVLKEDIFVFAFFAN
jgi:hypothetical protein